MKKRTAALFLSLTLVLGLGVGAFAAANSQTISAILSYETRVLYNGAEQSFQDAQGNAVFPILYNGTTYLPVRAVANMLGEQSVNYDAATKTVILGKTEKQPVALTTLKNSGGTKFSWIINDKSELAIVGSDATQTYTTGIQWHIWNGGSSVAPDRMVYFSVDGYSEITFSIWSDVENTARLYNQEGEVITSFTLKAGDLLSKTINIPGGTSKIAFGADGAPGATGNLKILDATVK